MARPKLQLSEEDVHDLAKIGCTYDEMANIFGCSVDTLVRNFQPAIKAGHDEMKESIRRKRLKIAMDDTHKQQASMLMFLSKTVLGEKEYAVIDDGRSAPSLKIEFVDSKPPVEK